MPWADISFAEKNKHFCRDLAMAVCRDDQNQVKRMLHTIKGVAGNLGAEPFHKASVKMSKTLTLGHPDPMAMDSLKKEFTRVLNSIKGLMEKMECMKDSNQSVAPTSADFQKIRELFKVMQENQFSSLELMESLRPQLAFLIPQEAMTLLERHLKEFKFAKALSVMDEHLHDKLIIDTPR